MTTFCQSPNVAQTIEKLVLHEQEMNARLDVEDEQDQEYAKTGLQALELEDGGGEVLRLLDADGLLLSRNVDPNILDKFQNFEAREDDVLLATYPKSGTHWVWEIVSMLKKSSPTLMSETIMPLDFLPANMLGALPSPRVLSTHMPFLRIPRDFLARDCKIVWVVRNPWDVAVSYYHFVKKLTVFEYSGDWNGFFELFLDGNIPYNSWFEHTQEWLKGMDTTSNILLVRYEDLHADFKKEVQRLADFLNVEVTDDTLDIIQQETSFANMSLKKVDITVPISKDGNSCVYRKGECGDWRNYFSEQQWAELKGAYRVSLNHHQRTLQYTSEKIN
ncbi:sulfotransferase 1C2-like [Littorina saxatilis]|uniref:Sulfotransferase domain-containing protein n=1 Tax=Littorina saxatilis TaxID=31220 RepID=A0AAN9FYW6_9CAEN